jgi:hypothetical protein
VQSRNIREDKRTPFLTTAAQLKPRSFEHDDLQAGEHSNTVVSTASAATAATAFAEFPSASPELSA